MLIYLVNLDRDHDRRTYMADQLDARGLEFERVSATLGLAMPDDIKPYFLKKDGRSIDSAMNAGEVGCYSTHLRICQKLIAQDEADYAFVMEDDLEFHPNFMQLLSSLDDLPEDWDIIRLSNPSKSAFITEKDLGKAGQLVRYWRVPNNTGCYLISKRGAKTFLQYQLVRKRAVDEDLRRPWEHGLKTYGILPPPVTSNIFDSSLEQVGGDRSLPGRKRFTDAPENPVREWTYRVREFGLLGCLTAIITTRLFKKKIRKASEPVRS